MEATHVRVEGVMYRRLLASMTVFGLVAGLILITADTAAAQSRPAARAGNHAVLKTPWGHPDIEGIWDRHSITPLERAKEFEGREFFTDAEIAKLEKDAFLVNTDEARQDDKNRDVSTAYNDFWWDRATKVSSTRRTSLVIDPPDGRIPPLTPQAQERAKRESARAVGSLGSGGRGANDPEDRSLWERCITQGAPRLAAGAYNANIQIFQTPDHVVIVHEQIHEARIVPLTTRPHARPNLRLWLGDARGHWEGNTLVVETTNFSDKTNFRGSTDGLKMVERFTRVDADTLDYQVTFIDPATWTKPWTALMRMPKTQGEMYEYACHEGNVGLKGILAGARQEEKEAGAARTTTSSRQQ
jgi:hypothetical protein